MAKRIQVGGRIESKEVGGIVTGAAEILDDAKGKKQSVINGETDDELVRLDQSKQDNLTFDNAPTEGSDNPVKSGGLYTAQQAILLAIAAINELIPSAASALNQLADKAFVNSSISTNTATFRGTSAAGLNEQQFLAWANGLEHDLNDYVFWQTSDAAGNTLFKRYKWNGTEWAYEYTLNNSTFTAEQWEAIQSGITALLVAKLRALPTAQELIQSFDSKQDVLTFDDVPTLGSTNPVKSSGIYNVIKAITDLIPAEATAQNQLADKADVAAKIVAAIPSWKGQYDALTDLQAVTGAKAGDMGCVKTTDSDGHAVLTFYQYSAQGAWVVYYVLRHYAQNKPATTGTTGDYPYNGMGRIELQKNIVNGVNTLTQAMLTQQNTIYVIQYDFTLGEDITIPANCVLEFEGGSISGEHTLTGTNTGICAEFIKIFGMDVIFGGTWNITDICADWFGAIADGTTDSTDAINKALFVATTIHVSTVILNSGTYRTTSTIYLRPNTILKGGGKVLFVWSGTAQTNILADFANDKSFVISTYSFFVNGSTIGEEVAYNQEVSSASSVTPCPMCGVENIRINCVSRVFGGIRIIKAYGYQRKNVSIENVYYSFVTMSSWNGGDDHCSTRYHLCSGFTFINDVNCVYAKNCIAGAVIDSTVSNDYLYPSVASNLSYIVSHSNNVFARYTTGLLLENFCNEGGNVGKAFVNCTGIEDISSWDEAVKQWLYAVRATSIHIGLGLRASLPSTCKGIRAFISDKVVNDDFNLETLGIDFQENDIYYPVYNLPYVISDATTFRYLFTRIYLNNIKEINIPENTELTITVASNNVFKRDIVIKGGSNETTVFNVSPSWSPTLEAENSSIKFENIKFVIPTRGATQKAYGCLVNCKGVVNLMFKNCVFNIGSTGSVIDNIRSLSNVGVVNGRSGCVIKASFINCVFNGISGASGTVVDPNCKADSVSFGGCTFNDSVTVGGVIANLYQDYGGTV